MDASTINTIITSCVSLLVSWLGFQVKKYADESVSSKSSIRSRTLSEVLVPLLNALNAINRLSWDEQEKVLLTLLHDKQVLIPPALSAQMQLVLSSDDAARAFALKKLCSMAESYASWYRKHLGYPYDAKKIDKRYTANTQRNEAIKGIVSLVFAVLWFLCSVYTIFALIYLSAHDYVAVPTFLNTAPVLVSLFGLPFVAVNLEK